MACAESQVRGERRRTALDWAAHIVEQNGRELAESLLTAARQGDWRAAEALMNRVYGRPEEKVVAKVDTHPASGVIRSMSHDEKLELLRRLQRGELADTEPPPNVGLAPLGR
jgi:hypothetical protein